MGYRPHLRRLPLESVEDCDRAGSQTRPSAVLSRPRAERFDRVIPIPISPRSRAACFKRHFGALMTHALCAEGETPDWRSPPSVGSGPFAIAGPCARVPGRYAEPRNVKNLVAHPWSWAIGSSTSAAQRSFDMVVCRRKARPFVLITKLGLQENGRPSPEGNGAEGQGLVRWADEPQAARLVKGASDVKSINIFRFAQCVTKRSASTSGAGVPVEVSGDRRTWQGCPAHP